MHTLSVVYVIWQRDMRHWWRDKRQIIGTLVPPLMFLFVLGYGLAEAMGSMIRDSGTAARVDYRQFMFPGLAATNLLFTSVTLSTSFVLDREFGILKEILVAPISRLTLIIGKTLGGATVATLQGMLFFALAPLAGISISPIMFVLLLPVMFIAAFAMNALGVAIASGFRNTQTFQVVNNTITVPMMFLNGSVFPLLGLPIWLAAFVKINPSSYAVDSLRHVVFASQGMSQDLIRRLPEYGLGISLFGVPLTLGHDLLIIVGFGAVMTVLAMILVSRQD
jgi:ABC-2 type transport system permease protein